MIRFNIKTKRIRRHFITAFTTFFFGILALFVVASFLRRVNWPGLIGTIIGFTVVGIQVRVKWNRLKHLELSYDGTTLTAERVFFRNRTLRIDDISAIIELTGSGVQDESLLIRYGRMPWKAIYLELEDNNAFLSALTHDHPGLEKSIVRVRK